MVLFALLANGCGVKEGEQVMDLSPTPLSNSTAVEVTPEAEASTEEVVTATPIPDFPIRLPCGDYSVTISRDVQKIAQLCEEKEAGREGYRYNVRVNNIPADGEWLPLFSDESLPESPLSSSFSPDGKLLSVAKLNWQNGVGRIWIFRTSDWELYNILEYDHVWTPYHYWTPDSHSIVVTSAKKGPGNPLIPLPGGDLVYLLSIDGEMTPLLSQDDLYPDRDGVGPYWLSMGMGPAWSPDGRYMAYLAFAPGDSDVIQLVLVDTVLNRKEIVSDELMFNPKFYGYPDWSPDGQKILFRSSENLKVFDMETRTMKTIVDSQQIASFVGDNSSYTPIISYKPIWAADSQSVIFNSLGNFMVDIHDGNLKELANNNPYIQLTADGKKLICWTHEDAVSVCSIVR